MLRRTLKQMHRYSWNSYVLYMSQQRSYSKNICKCRVNVKVGVKCVPCSEYLDVLSWLNRGGSGLSQPGSEEGWQCIFPLCLILVGHPPLGGGAPKMSCLPEYKCHCINTGELLEVALRVQRANEGHIFFKLWYMSHDWGCQVGCNAPTSPKYPLKPNPCFNQILVKGCWLNQNEEQAVYLVRMWKIRVQRGRKILEVRLSHR